MAEAVAHGLDAGWARAHKLARQPSKATLMSSLFAEVMLSLNRLVAESERRAKEATMKMIDLQEVDRD